MDALAHFVEAVGAPTAPGALEQGLESISAFVDPSGPILDVGAGLDRLAERHGSDRPDRLAASLFAPGCLSPNRSEYFDPANSLIDRVLDRRLGIPLSLSCVAVSVGERCGAPIHGVGMPGHFLLGSPQSEYFFDPFASGRRRSRAEIDVMFLRLHGRRPTDAEMSRVDHPAMLVRTLANLRIACRRRGDTEKLIRVLEALVATETDRLRMLGELAEVLARTGRWDRGRSVCARLAAEYGTGELSDAWAAEARRLLALMN